MILVDTTVIIDLARETQEAREIIERFTDHDFFISAITREVIYTGLGYTPEKKGKNLFTKMKNGYEKILSEFIILDINERYLDNNLLDNIVGIAGSNFSILSFQELLLLHYYLRKHAERTSLIQTQGWAIIANLDGFEIPFSYNLTNQGIWAGFFSAIVGFIQSLFDSKPKYISFGTTYIHKLRFIFGKNYFMAIDTGFTSDLLLIKDFQRKFLSTPFAI